MNQINKSNQSYQHDVNQASRAAVLLENDILVAAFESVEQQALDGMIESKDEAKRTEFWNRLHAVRDVKAYIEDIVMSGKIASKKMSKAEK